MAMGCSIVQAGNFAAFAGLSSPRFESCRGEYYSASGGGLIKSKLKGGFLEEEKEPQTARTAAFNKVNNGMSVWSVSV